MSLFEISREFVTFFLDGADVAIIDWFACTLTMLMATGVFSLVLKPLVALVRGFGKR